VIRGTVVGFDVSMENTSFVHIFYTAGELGEDVPAFGGGGKVLRICVKASPDIVRQVAPS
jgi:hypothetical protein